LFAQIRAHAPANGAPVNFTMVNLPGYLIERNIGAATFDNGINELAVIASPRVASLQLARAALPGAPPVQANGSSPIELDLLRSELAEPSRVVLLYAAPASISLLTLDRHDSLAPR
jgi:hypothetical protein